ncbi:M3 family metallopeptidase [Pseudomonas sp. FP2338]|uniref:M3 family metallopeptidase n=1 Tax=Pseudomonas sp. FP2338 TaxID=2954093 RepID=UPI0027323DDE|nr:M3 family metallopeptidase [Pseudomonas sp. FP2338]WLH85928.1 M3 family metallopeptidase [Pseudomonas sp. FP2338]
MSESNPLLLPYDLPPFSAIRAEHLVPAIEQIIADSRNTTATIIASQSLFPTWDDLVQAVEALEARLDGVLNVIELLDSIPQESAWKQASHRSYELAMQYRAELAANNDLYQLHRQLADSPIAALFNQQRQSALRKILRKYHLAGLDLSPEKQLRLKALNLQIDTFSQEFRRRVRDSSDAWRKHIQDKALLSGLPDAALARMAAAARAASLDGWLLTLSEQSFQAVMSYADHRALRQEMMMAYYSRAVGSGPDDIATDNEPVLTVLLDSRHQKAQLLGYANFAELALVEQMAETTDEVTAFVHQQIDRARMTFAHEAQQLQRYAAQRGIDALEPWDYNYYAEKIRQDVAGVSQDAVRKYFPLETVLQRLCAFTKMLFGVELIEQTTVDTWHPDVRVFELREYAEPIGHLFIDSYRRVAGGAIGIASGLRNHRMTAEGRPQRPIAMLRSQLPRPIATQPCLLDHLQLRVLLHEFGHCLQHLLTVAPYRAISGMGQLSHDAAEFFGQVLEQFCFTPLFLTWLSGHFQTGDPLPDDMATQMSRFVHTQTSQETASILLTSLVDFELHRTYGDGRTPHEVFTHANVEVGHLQWPDGARPINSFEQPMGSYGAKMYSYKWSGVLARQAFERFERDGLFNPETGKAFRDVFITEGDTRTLLSSLALFRGEGERCVEHSTGA